MGDKKNRKSWGHPEPRSASGGSFPRKRESRRVCEVNLYATGRHPENHDGRTLCASHGESLVTSEAEEQPGVLSGLLGHDIGWQPFDVCRRLQRACDVGGLRPMTLIDYRAVRLQKQPV